MIKRLKCSHLSIEKMSIRMVDYNFSYLSNIKDLISHGIS